MRGLLLLSVVAAVVVGSAGAFAAPLDGVWSAQLASQGSCAFGGELTLNLSDNQISGALEDPSGTSPVQGFLNGGIGSLRMGASVALGRFSNDTFSLDFRSDCGLRHLQGARIAKPVAASSSADRRKEAETQYSELVARAASGDLSADFKAMRYAYPLTSGYDPALENPETARLSAAFKAGDCSDTLVRSDAALKRDFTNPRTHAMRAECFEKAGNAAQAALEHGIERGLMDSLRKGADGKTRGTAYVVGSYREQEFAMEAADLVDGSAMLSLWGPDYRHYDLVVARSRATGERRVVWFDSELLIEGLAQFLPPAAP